MSHQLRRAKILVLPLLIQVLVACSSDESTDSSQNQTDLEPDPADLIWSACEGSDTLECASLNVPVDYTQPDLESMDIALARLAAPEQTRKGSLVLNPGGPGASGVDLMSAIDRLGDDELSIPVAIRNEYDIVSFDPRGIGKSRAVDCSEFGLNELDNYPVSASAIVKLEEDAIALATACYEKYGDYLSQLGSNNVARDMDRMRKGLDEDELNFIGYSYGTRLIATYLQLFPDQVGSLIMDAALPPSPSLQPLVRDSLVKSHANFISIFQDCAEVVADCSQESVVAALTRRVDSLIASGDLETFDLLGSVLLTAAELPAFGEQVKEPLIAYATVGDVSILEDFLVVLESEYGEDVLADDDNDTAFTAVLCADDAARPTASDLITLLTDYHSVSDLFAEASVANAGLCMGWPAAVDPVESFAMPVNAGLLIVGGTTDAQTPLVWAQQFAEVAGSPLIVSGHPGHTVVFQNKNACVDEQVVEFLRESINPEQRDCLLP